MDETYVAWGVFFRTTIFHQTVYYSRVRSGHTWYNQAMIQIGYLSACIGGDHRYTSTLTVEADPTTKQVVVKVRETAPRGGMDGPGGSYDAGLRFNATLEKPTPRKLMEVVRMALGTDDVFANYGKPTKNFRWGCSHPRVLGLSVAKAKLALDDVFP